MLSLATNKSTLNHPTSSSALPQTSLSTRGDSAFEVAAPKLDIDNTKQNKQTQEQIKGVRKIVFFIFFFVYYYCNWNTSSSSHKERGQPPTRGWHNPTYTRLNEGRWQTVGQGEKIWSWGKRTHHTDTMWVLQDIKRAKDACQKWLTGSTLQLTWPRINLTKQVYQTCVNLWHFPQTIGSFFHTHYSELPRSCFSGQIGFTFTHWINQYCCLDFLKFN